MKFKELKPGEPFKFSKEEQICFKGRPSNSSALYVGLNGYSCLDKWPSNCYDDYEVTPFELKGEFVEKKVLLKDAPYMVAFKFKYDNKIGLNLQYYRIKSPNHDIAIVDTKSGYLSYLDKMENLEIELQ